MCTSHLLNFSFLQNKLSDLRAKNGSIKKNNTHFSLFFSTFARSSHFSWRICISKAYFSFHLAINPCFSAPLTAHCPRWTDGKWHPEPLILPNCPYILCCQAFANSVFSAGVTVSPTIHQSCLQP